MLASLGINPHAINTPRELGRAGPAVSGHTAVRLNKG